MNEKIDFVIIWVDGGDAEWRKEKNKYAGIPNEEINGDARFRDWDNLKYWFRGVEKFAPWVGNIYFVRTYDFIYREILGKEESGLCDRINSYIYCHC